MDRTFYFTCGKRVFDIMLTLPAIIVLSPIIIILSLLVSLFFGSSPFFCQQRPGLLGKPFILYKFRTMTEQTDEDGHLLPDAERLTRFGRFLRSTSLDELPELFNVLKGDMSLVGPRPLLMQYLNYYTSQQARRHEIKPGITGWAQVNGRNNVKFSERLKMDVWYVDNVSLLLDLKIIFLTFICVLRHEGVRSDFDTCLTEVDDCGFYEKSSETQNGKSK